MKYYNTITKEYPVSLNRIRKLYPNISIPDSVKEVKEFKLVNPVNSPTSDDFSVVAEGIPNLIGNEYYQNWIVTAVPESEILQRSIDSTNSLKNSIISLTQQRLDSFAATRGYDGVNASAKYKSITADDLVGLPQAEQDLILKFSTESKYLATVTARTWAKLYIILGEVEAGIRNLPSSFADIESELPLLEWPV